MWDIKILGYELFNLFYNFFIYSFIGWIYESCYVSILNRKWVNRGFLNGPIIPLYGAGASIIYITFWHYRDDFLFVFFGGMLLATMLEYITSLIMEILLHAKWWDYCDKKFNLNGRICLSASLLWGALSICMIEFLQPIVNRWIAHLPRITAIYFGYFIFAIFAGDFAVTVVNTLQLDKMLGELQRLRMEIIDYVDSIKIYEAKEEWKNKRNLFKIPDVVEHIKVLIDENKDRLIENNKNREGFELKSFRLEIEKNLKEYVGRFQRKTSKTSFIQKRLLNAFPNMHSVRRDDALKDLRDLLKKHRRE
jgi:uncharacterized membrane protein